MYVKFGSFTHDANLTSFSFDRSVRHNPRSGTPLVETRRVSMRMEVLDDNQADLRTRIDAVIAAYQGSTVGAAWEFYHDDTTLSSHSLPLTGLLGPIRVVQAPSFPESDGAEYATLRTITIVLEADYSLSTLPEIIEFREQVNITGTGGPRKIATELISGVPVSDTVATYTIVRAVQQGQLLGHSNYPFPPAPIWPTLEDVEQREIGTGSATRYDATNLRNFPVTWKYVFTGGSAMYGVANS